MYVSRLDDKQFSREQIIMFWPDVCLDILNWKLTLQIRSVFFDSPNMTRGQDIGVSFELRCISQTVSVGFLRDKVGIFNSYHNCSAEKPLSSEILCVGDSIECYSICYRISHCLEDNAHLDRSSAKNIAQEHDWFSQMFTKQPFFDEFAIRTSITARCVFGLDACVVVSADLQRNSK